YRERFCSRKVGQGLNDSRKRERRSACEQLRVLDCALSMVIDRASAFAQSSQQTRHLGPFQQRSHAHRLHFVQRDKQVSAAVYKNSQLVQGHERGAKGLLYDSVDYARPATRVNNVLSDRQHIVLLLISSRCSGGKREPRARFIRWSGPFQRS